MSDLPEDQLSGDEGGENLPAMGRGKAHPKYQWIVDGLVAIQKSPADLSRALGWDQPTMSRQLKGKRVLKADDVRDIHKFFADNGLIVSAAADIPSTKLTTSDKNVSSPAESPQADLEGKLDLSIKLLDELREAVSDLRGRVQQLERERHAEDRHDHPKGLRRR